MKIDPKSNEIKTMAKGENSQVGFMYRVKLKQ